MKKDPLKKALKQVRRDAFKQANRAKTREESEDGSAACALAGDALRALKQRRRAK